MKALNFSLFQEKNHRLFTRVFLHGVLLIVVVCVAGGVAFALFGSSKLWHGLPSRMADSFASDMVPGEREQTRLGESLTKIHQILNVGIAVYTYDGEKVASAGSLPPLPLLRQEATGMTRQKILRRGSKKSMFLPVPKRPGVKPCYVIMDWPFSGDPSRMTIGLVVILLLVALTSWPLARAIARPLERLTITAKKLAEGDLGARTGVSRKDEVGVLAQTIDEMAMQLERRIKGEKELLANVSHEIRTPLSRIKVALELCGEASTTPKEVREHLEGIAGDVTELNLLIEDVLIAARLDIQGPGKDGTFVALRKTNVHPETIANACEEGFGNVHPGRQLEVSVEHFETLIAADLNLLRRALDNLLDNAVKYSKAPSTVELRVKNGADGAHFEVLDRGIGVSTDDLHYLFDPFFRSERSRSRRAGGSGLGLTLCKKIVEAHDASIVALRREGGGMVLRIVVPWARDG